MGTLGSRYLELQKTRTSVAGRVHRSFAALRMTKVECGLHTKGLSL